MSVISSKFWGRVTKELRALARDPPPGISASLVDYSMRNDASSANQVDSVHSHHNTVRNPITQIEASITGPPGTPYQNGVFQLDIHLNPGYPVDPPQVRFVTRIYHPNIDEGGRICLDTLKTAPLRASGTAASGYWTPALSLGAVLSTIQLLLAQPNPGIFIVIFYQFLYRIHLFLLHSIPIRHSCSIFSSLCFPIPLRAHTWVCVYMRLDDGLVRDVALEYATDRATFWRKAELFTKKYACGHLQGPNIGMEEKVEGGIHHAHGEMMPRHSEDVSSMSEGKIERENGILDQDNKGKPQTSGRLNTQQESNIAEMVDNKLGGANLPILGKRSRVDLMAENITSKGARHDNHNSVCRINTNASVTRKTWQEQRIDSDDEEDNGQADVMNHTSSASNAINTRLITHPSLLTQYSLPFTTHGT